MKENKIICHAELVSASTPLVTIQNKEEILNQVQDDNRHGFTLIELLVVVLIIGILAAVALPQYQRAVEKSRGVEGLIMLKAIAQANEVYKLANGNYSEDLNDLDISIGTIVLDGNMPSVKNKYFVCRAQGGGGDRQYYGVCRRLSHNYILVYRRTTQRPECISGTTETAKYCQALTGRTQVPYYLD